MHLIRWYHPAAPPVLLVCAGVSFGVAGKCLPKREHIMTNFEDLGLSSELMQAVQEMGYTTPSPIQASAIPVVLSGRDIIGQAQTGTGKTASFGIPMIQMVDTNSKSTQALVLCPTRELALQVANELRKLGKFRKNLFISAIFGGDPMNKQIEQLRRGAQIVVGTPGRVMDHLDRGTLRIDDITMVVLDEADEMLNMGFREDIEEILSTTPKERQTVLFSATMSAPILAITRQFQRDPAMVKMTRQEITTDTVEQLYFNVKEGQKTEIMSHLVQVHGLQLMLVFCNTKMKTVQVSDELQALGLKADAIHGDLQQKMRQEVMNKFRSGQIQILVATDVAARGIDVNNVDAVFNYDVPMDIENYVHRIGRTGRAGKTGKAFTFFTRSDRGKQVDIERYTKVQLTKGTIPGKEEILGVKRRMVEGLISESLEKPVPQFMQDMLRQYVDAGISMEAVATSLLQWQFKGWDEIPDRVEEDSFERRGSSNSRFEKRGESNGRFERRGNDRFEKRGPSSSGRFDREGGRNERGSAGPRKPAGPRNDADMTRLFLNLGRQDRVSPGDIVGAIAGETRLNGQEIGRIDIFDSYSFVDVPNQHAENIVRTMNGNSIKGRKVFLEKARPAND